MAKYAYSLFYDDSKIKLTEGYGKTYSTYQCFIVGELTLKYVQLSSVKYPDLKSRMLNDNNLSIYMRWRNVMYCSLSTLLCDEGAIISKPISFKNFHAK